MPFKDAELRNWHDWMDPDFFLTERHRESNVITLFLRQMLPNRLFRTRMTLTGWSLCCCLAGIGVGCLQHGKQYSISGAFTPAQQLDTQWYPFANQF